MSAPNRIDELLEAWEASVEQGAEQTPDALCQREPELIEELRGRIDKLKVMRQWLAPAPLETATWSQTRSPDSSSARPERIGPYQVIGELQSGGMGVVYLCEQENPRRQVALKMIRPGRVSRETLRRFHYEGQVLGRLRHPGIAQIFEAGTTDLGHGPQPFFAMEFIEGRPLTAYANEHQLDHAARLALMVKILAAVEHAHKKGVIHRDLKPGNILVDGVGEPKVLDFGVARGTNHDLEITTVETDVGRLVGTLPYMSPEQVQANPDELDTRSDVYALGVVCYELLAGKLPYDVRNKSIPDAARVIEEDHPTPLSRFDRRFRGDLDTIMAKALEKDKTRRYQSCTEFSSDLSRYLKREPIQARPASAWYQFRKYAQRNRALVGAAAAAFMALALGLMGTSLALARATAATARAEKATTQASQALGQALAAEKRLERQVLENSLRAAELSAQKGRWTETLSLLEGKSSAKEDGDLIVDLGLARARAHVALNQVEPALRELDDLERRTDLGARLGVVQLLRADLELSRGQDSEGALRLLESSLANMPSESRQFAAERAYAQGLLAKGTNDALIAFREAREIDPYYQAAQQAEMMILMMLGRLEELEDRARVVSSMFVDDPSAKLCLAVGYAFRGRADDARAELAKAKSQLEEKVYAPLTRIVDLISGSVGELGKEGIAATPSTTTLAGFLGRFLLISSEAEAFKGTTAFGLAIKSMPAIQASWGRITSIVASQIFVSETSQETLDEIAAIFEKSSDGSIAYFGGILAVNFGDDATPDQQVERMVQAEKSFQAAVEAETLIPALRTNATYWAAYAQSMLGRPDAKRGPGDPAIRERGIKNIGRLLETPNMPEGDYGWLLKFATDLKDLDLAGEVLARWQVKHGATETWRRNRANWALSTKAFATAIDDCDEILRAHPDDADMTRIREAAIAQARELAARFPPKPE